LSFVICHAFRPPGASPVLPFCHNGITIPRVKTLTIKVPDALFAEIAGAAKARNVPKSEIVRRAYTVLSIPHCAATER